MAEKKSQGGGGLSWLFAGFLLGVAVTLGGLAFLSHDPADAPPAQAQSAVVEPQAAAPQTASGAQPAAPPLAGAAPGQAQAGDAAALTAPAAPKVSTAMPAQAADNVDPEVADDAASVGMTSRAPPR